LPSHSRTPTSRHCRTTCTVGSRSVLRARRKMHTHPTLCRHPAALAYRSCGSTTPSVNKTYHGRRSTTSCSHCLYVDRVARGQIHGAHRGSFNVLYKDASLVNLRVLIQLTDPLHRLNRMDLDRRERLAPCADSSGPVSGREQLRRRPFPPLQPRLPPSLSRPLSPRRGLWRARVASKEATHAQHVPCTTRQRWAPAARASGGEAGGSACTRRRARGSRRRRRRWSKTVPVALALAAHAAGAAASV